MEEKEKQSTVTKDLEIENMREFLLENQDIKLSLFFLFRECDG